MRWIALLGIIAIGCGYNSPRSDSERLMETRAREVIETCARSQSCAQRADHDAVGYSQCVGDKLALVDVDHVESGVISSVFRCDIGEGYLFRVVVHGLSGPAYEEVRQCQSGCGTVEDAFAPVA